MNAYHQRNYRNNHKNYNLSNVTPRMNDTQRALNRFNPGRQYRGEEAFDVRLSEIASDDPRCVLLRDVYNAGTAGKRLDCEHVLEECKKYYPSCFVLQDVFEDLIEKTPRHALTDVQYAFVCFHREQMDAFSREDTRKAAEPALSLG